MNLGSDTTRSFVVSLGAIAVVGAALVQVVGPGLTGILPGGGEEDLTRQVDDVQAIVAPVLGED